MYYLNCDYFVGQINIIIIKMSVVAHMVLLWRFMYVSTFSYKRTDIMHNIDRVIFEITSAEQFFYSIIYYVTWAA